MLTMLIFLSFLQMNWFPYQIYNYLYIILNLSRKITMILLIKNCLEKSNLKLVSDFKVVKSFPN